MESARILAGRHHPARPPFFRNLGRRLNWLSARQLLTQIGFLALAAAVTVLLAFPTPVSYQVGDVSAHTIRADRGFRLVDQSATERERRQAAARVAPVFVLDDIQTAVLEDEAETVFRRGRELTVPPAAGTVPPPEASETRLPDLRALETMFYKTFNVPFESGAWEALVRLRFSAALERQVLSLAAEVMGQGLLDRPNPFSGRQPRAAAVVVLSSRREYTVPAAAGLLDTDAAGRFLEVRSRMLQARWNKDETALIAALAKGLMQPNLKPDGRETERRMEEARASAPVSYFNVRAGEVIVREGSVITPEAVEKIKGMGGPADWHAWFFRFLGLFLVLSVFFNVSVVLSPVVPKNRFQPLPVKEQAFLALLLMLVALLAHSGQTMSVSLAWDFDFIDARTVFYAMPITTVTMLTAIFFGTRKATFAALFAAVAAGAVSPAGERLTALLYCYNGAIAATWCLRNMNERGHLIPAAFWVMVVNCLTLFGLTLFNEAQWNLQTAYNFGAACLSGVLSAVVTSGLIPLIEAAFGFNTTLMLLELGNLDRPLLRELMLSAPGTYHHSVIVGAMVEAGAEAIGANPHLAKVGAYYHDIGKIKKPLYFVENQSGENRHDTLAPSMSALILIGHVREGAEIARENGLPRNLIDIVEQHHGTSLMAFFYHKAKEQRQEGQPEVNEGDYRYPGPRPRSKEAGLVMLGDICEAATRSLSEPTPAKIKNLVRQLVNQIFNDGQLEECSLTTREIAEVVNTFTTILIGIYHHRVAYPGGAKKPAAPDKPAAPGEARPAAGAKGEPVKEVYGHSPVEPTKVTTH
jgi:putative nucleotidyltransferase with HDIG domain